jgi:L-threonylcarbamoyladenylate synthase
MKVFDRSYVDTHKSDIIKTIRDGSVFIYPTDTIYGLGCNALNETSVQKIRTIKHREQKPFSVVAPNKEWITEHTNISKEKVDEYLPGPYTLFVQTKDVCVAESVNPIDATLGVRIPDHWFTELVQEAGVPFVTTSVNIAGEPFMNKLEDLSDAIKDQVDICIYEGPKEEKPSEKIDLTSL